MDTRLDYTRFPGAMAPLYAAERYLKESSLEPELRCLVQIRASIINGCAFCLALHHREAEALGINADRTVGTAAWREAGWYSPRECAALAVTDALTELGEGALSDEGFAAARAVFNEQELVDLVLTIATINAWNRFSIGFRTAPEGASAVFEWMQSQR